MKILFTVTTDLSFDQRMIRICKSLSAKHDIILTGSETSNSIPIIQREYTQCRLKNYFKKGFFFYAEYNIKLLFYLFFQPCDVICAIDLDTILPCLIVAKLRKKVIVYDAHEYFTEMEEIKKKSFQYKIWKFIERISIPQITLGYTISKGYAKLFKDEYQSNYEVIKNATFFKPRNINSKKKYILYQGAVNYGRELDTLILAMHFVDYPLVICGKGNYYKELKELTKKEKLEHKITFTGFILPKQLQQYTEKAKIGITLFTNATSNRFSLSNKFFDYLHCGVPQIAMQYPEYESFNSKHNVAILIPILTVKNLANAINHLINNDEIWNTMQKNSIEASKVNCWQKEEVKLIQFYDKIESSLQSK